MPESRPTGIIPLRERIEARHVAERAARPAVPRSPPTRSTRLAHYVYFIGASEGLVKIGMSHDPEARLAEFQAGCPVTLSILAQTPGYFVTEAAYHRRFAQHRVRGEWFERHADILAEIEALS